MKDHFPQDRSGSASARLLMFVVIFGILPALLIADAPTWWTSQGVLVPSGTANDYAAANQGQLKNFALKAYLELQGGLPGGLGSGSSATALTGLITSWGTFSPSGTFTEVSGTSTNDYAAANIGQVKNVSKLFYDVLLQAGYTGQPLATGTYPWLSSTNGANDYAMVNIGQVKNAFSFDLSVFLPTWWQTAYFGGTGVDPAADPAGDGLSNMQKYLQGLNPLQADNPAVQLDVNVTVQ